MSSLGQLKYLCIVIYSSCNALLIWTKDDKTDTLYLNVDKDANPENLILDSFDSDVKKFTDTTKAYHLQGKSLIIIYKNDNQRCLPLKL